MMVPDCYRRLVKAFEELNEYLKNESELTETKEFVAAKEVIESAKSQIQN